MKHKKKIARLENKKNAFDKMGKDKNQGFRRPGSLKKN